VSHLILPEAVAHADRLERSLEKLNLLRERVSWLTYFESELKAIDGQLSLVKAVENATEPGLTPGYWHVKRDNPAMVPTYLPIQGPLGEFVEPHSGILEDLRRMDLQRSGALEEIARAQNRKAADERKRRENAKLERVEALAGHMKAIDSPGVSRAARRRSVRGK